MTRLLAAFLSLITFLALPGLAVAADAANGEVLARRWCAACHVVSTDQQHANGQAPPFSAIAKTPDLEPSRLALFLLLPHPKMPDMALSRSEAADLAAYIQKQGK